MFNILIILMVGMVLFIFIIKLNDFFYLFLRSKYIEIISINHPHF